MTDVDKFLLLETRIDEKSSEPKRIIEGGLDLNLIEGNYTQTLFYCAQVYQQAGEIEKGINYSTQTMQRQMATQTYQLKDFCVNCLSLSDYFMHVGQFAQAEYLLYAALSLIPTDMTRKKKLRASIQISTGQYYQFLLAFLIQLYGNDKTSIPEEVNKCTF